MSTLAQKIEFAEKYICDKEGRPFKLPASRRWVPEEMWRPADGFKWWPKEDVEYTSLRDEERELVGKITDWTFDEHEHIELRPVIMTAVKIPRQEGKTFNVMAFNLACLFIDYNESITYVAAAGDQADVFFEENYVAAIEQNKELKRSCEIVGSTIYVPRTNSRFEVVPTSHRSITGRGRSRFVFDESRDIPGRVVMAALPAIFARNGWQCPNGHVKVGPDSSVRECKVCSARLIPWQARVLAMSSAGAIEGGSRDWFMDLVENLTEEPDPNAHLYHNDESQNPAVSTQAKDFVARVFSKIDSTKDFVDIEVHNISRKLGTEYLSHSQVEQRINKKLRNQESSARRSVSFLDTSRTKELTSWTIFADTSDDWSSLVVERIDVWTPANTDRKLIDEMTVWDHFETYMPLFPNLELWVDTRVMPWAERFVAKAKLEAKWGARVHRFQGKGPERNTGYKVLAEDIRGGAIELMDNETLRKEFKVARKFYDIKGDYEVREENRKIRHLDILDGHANCAYQVWVKRSTKPGVGLRHLKQESPATRLLRRSMRPVTSGLGPNSL